MATSENTQKILRIPLTELFNLWKASAPTEFGSKVPADVDQFGVDPEDASKFIIIFNEE
jgi:hypothetical protein